MVCMYFLMIFFYSIKVLEKGDGMNVLYKKFNMDELIPPFLAAQDISLNSRTTYFNALVQFARWCTDKKITHPKHETVLTYKFWLDTKQLSSYTKAVYIVVIRRFFLWADEEGLYDNVSRKVKGIKRYSKSHQKESLSIDALKKLLASIDCSDILGKRDFALILVSALLGMAVMALLLRQRNS